MEFVDYAIIFVSILLGGWSVECHYDIRHNRPVFFSWTMIVLMILILTISIAIKVN